MISGWSRLYLMNSRPVSAAASVFGDLTPDAVLDAVEAALGRPCTNVCRPLNSYINRVYEVGLAGSLVIAKFYRPGRWSTEALQDELEFVDELAAEELPIVPPIRGRDGRLLHEAGGIRFAVLPKRGGRALGEPTPNEWAHIGRLLARMHSIGARRMPRDRIRIGPNHSMATHLRYILDHGRLPPATARRYEAAAEAIRELVRPLFDGVEIHRIHGDCHRGNILHRPGDPFHLIDFDDMAVGPAVQDLWMLLPGRPAECPAELDRLLEGYGTFCSFDRSTLRLVDRCARCATCTTPHGAPANWPMAAWPGLRPTGVRPRSGSSRFATWRNSENESRRGWSGTEGSPEALGCRGGVPANRRLVGSLAAPRIRRLRRLTCPSPFRRLRPTL